MASYMRGYGITYDDLFQCRIERPSVITGGLREDSHHLVIGVLKNYFVLVRIIRSLFLRQKNERRLNSQNFLLLLLLLDKKSKLVCSSTRNLCMILRQF